MKIYVRDASKKDTCLSLNDLQKCYRKIYNKKAKEENPENPEKCTLCIDRNSPTDDTLKCQSKSYCDTHLNNRIELKVKKSNIDNYITWIFYIIGSLTLICCGLDVLCAIKDVKEFMKELCPFLSNFIGHNFTDVIKFNIILFVLMFSLKILYTSLTDDKIKNSETNELQYDLDVKEFRD
jgi:hypothetical protein